MYGLHAGVVCIHRVQAGWPSEPPAINTRPSPRLTAACCCRGEDILVGSVWKDLVAGSYNSTVAVGTPNDWAPVMRIRPSIRESPSELPR
jgi:hypothetical protein